MKQEIVTYTEDSHLQKCDNRVKEIYNELKDMILTLSPTITVKVNKMYIAFKNNDRNFVSIHTKRSELEF